MTVQRVIVDVELEDGRTFKGLRVKNPALVAYDLERTSKKWPDARDAPMLWRTFIAWRQLVNDGEYTGDFKAFRDRDCAEIDQDTDATGEGATEDVDPTNGGAESTPASSSPPSPE